VPGPGSVDQVCVPFPIIGCFLAVGLFVGDGVALFDGALPAGSPIVR